MTGTELRYPLALTSASGKPASSTLSSCRHRMSGVSRCSQDNRRSLRALTELTFQVAIFSMAISRGCSALCTCSKGRVQT